MLIGVSIKETKLKTAEMVKVLRKREKLSQEQLAMRLNLSRITIKNLEAGKNATLDTLFKVLQYFDLLQSFADLVDRETGQQDYDSIY
ncbi:XRE family transcriptional regulator [Mucilaginibacter hurinus]|uniref:XRE family transcriptional regulator n=1 Tax=Mucilaginibacter hurinus TaxID=2201324 RepID=A0A367GTY5_9SPHI|nr:helix-turn-helix transcriptional regulator [Mucilaginibacter hurinus]RCH56874.1 XRE family transcriptional regulator [Mucilaginibacter hurinus]